MDHTRNKAIERNSNRSTKTNDKSNIEIQTIEIQMHITL